MGLPANWQPRVEWANFRLTGVPFVVLGMAGSILACISIIRQSTMLWLPAPTDLSGSPEPSKLILFLFLEGGYIAGLLLLLVPIGQTRSLAIGIVLSTSALHLGIEGLKALGMTIEGMWGFKLETAWMKDMYPPLLLYVFLQVWTAAASLLSIVKGQKARKWLFLAGGMVLGTMLFGQSMRFEAKAWRDFAAFVEEKQRESKSAHDTIQAIGWCAIEFRAKDPEAGYPRDLDQIAGNSICIKPWSLTGEPDYAFLYLPTFDAYGKVETFFVQAIGRSEPHLASSSYGMDPSGITLVLSPTSPGPRGWNRIADTTTAGYIYAVQRCLGEYAKEHPNAGFPKHLAEAKSCTEELPVLKEAKSNVFQILNYRFTYAAPVSGTSQPIRWYEVDVRCREYGKTCIRNLHADPRKVTGTIEDRPAKPSDPDEPQCELHSTAVLSSCHE